jgi:hypothetical protein
MLCPSYYCLYSLFNKIRDKGRTVSPGSEGAWWGMEGEGGEMAQTLYAHMNKQKKMREENFIRLYTCQLSDLSHSFQESFCLVD